MPTQLATDLATLATRRRALRLGAGVMGGAVLAACGGRAGAQTGALACVATPSEIRGPFPADGTQRGRALNILAEQGIERRDIRSSIAGLAGRAEGVPLKLELKVVDAGGCTPLAGRAVYLWQCDALGAYSMYDRTDVNYLRGLQAADRDGVVRFATIVPGCYGGRAPHLHFEVFESVAAAMSGGRDLLVSQLALATTDARPIYAARDDYGESLANLARWPAERDWLLAGDEPEVQAAQTLVLSGDPQRGYRGTATIGLQ
jgi:protocatechuate 3,4-dioxygenase beta subunit